MGVYIGNCVFNKYMYMYMAQLQKPIHYLQKIQYNINNNCIFTDKYMFYNKYLRDTK